MIAFAGINEIFSKGEVYEADNGLASLFALLLRKIYRPR